MFLVIAYYLSLTIGVCKMDKIIALLLILIPITICILIRCLIKKCHAKLLFVLTFILIIEILICTWFFLPEKVILPEYDLVEISIYNQEEYTKPKDVQQKEIINIINALSVRRHFFYDDVPYHANDADYIYLRIVLKKNHEIVFSEGYHLGISPFKSGTSGYDDDMNKIINPETLIGMVKLILADKK